QEREVDLLLDNKYFSSDKATSTFLLSSGVINNIPKLHEWRNIILAGTSFPKNLSDVGADTVDVLPRTEWIVWKKIINKSANTLRLPVYSDYGNSHNDPFQGDPRITRMSANIRYTAKDKFIIFKGRWTRRYGFGQFHSL